MKGSSIVKMDEQTFPVRLKMAVEALPNKRLEFVCWGRESFPVWPWLCCSSSRIEDSFSSASRTERTDASLVLRDRDMIWKSAKKWVKEKEMLRSSSERNHRPIFHEVEDQISVACRYASLSESRCQFLKDEWLRLWKHLAGPCSEALKPLSTNGLGEWSIVPRMVGSVARGTALCDSDLDVLLVLSTPEIQTKESAMRNAEFVFKCLKEGLENMIESWSLRDCNAALSNGKTLRLSLEGNNGSQFDVIPVINVGGVCYTLEKDGSLATSNDEDAEIAVSDLRGSRAGFSELVYCLKVCGRLWNFRHDKDVQIGAAAFESLAMRVALVLSKDEWIALGIEAKVVMAMDRLHECLGQEICLNPPNSSTIDLLAKFRRSDSKVELMSWCRSWKSKGEVVKALYVFIGVCKMRSPSLFL
jgi:hypothetical protein